MKKVIRSTVFRLLRYFSTVLSSFRYSLETCLSASNSRDCGRSTSPRTVTEKSLMPLNSALLIVEVRTRKKSRSNTMPRQLGQSLIALKAALLIAAVWVMFLPAASFAGIDTVIEFIVTNNPDLQELKGINKSILSQLKVEAKGAASYGQLIQEGTSSLDKAQTRYSVGLTASIPLISPAEKSQRRIEEAQKERTLRLDAAELIKTYKAERLAISEESSILTSLYNELQWIGKRVEAGVDSQKDYNAKLHDYLNKRKDHELRKEQVSLILEKILSYVAADKRHQLKGMLIRTQADSSLGRVAEETTGRNGQDISKD